MRKIASIAVIVLGTLIAGIQQGAWIVKGYYQSASFGQVVCSLVWSSVIIGFSVLISKSIKNRSL